MAGAGTAQGGAQQYDARKYEICAPFFGQRGDKFLLFEQDFLAGLAGKGDEDASLAECLEGTDPGGDDPAAQPIPANAAA
jgi:hypothetical protein